MDYALIEHTGIYWSPFETNGRRGGRLTNPTNQHYLPHRRIPARLTHCRGKSVFQARLNVRKLSRNHFSQVKPKRTKLSRSFLFLNSFLNPKMAWWLLVRRLRTGSCWCHCPAVSTSPPSTYSHTPSLTVCNLQPHVQLRHVGSRFNTPHGLSDVLTAGNLHRTHMSFKGEETWRLTVSCSPTMWAQLHIDRQQEADFHNLIHVFY